MVFTSVDLPAPLSPTRASTSPARTSSSMFFSAWTAPKRFETPRSDSTVPVPTVAGVGVTVIDQPPGLTYAHSRTHSSGVCPRDQGTHRNGDYFRPAAVQAAWNDAVQMSVTL